mmetsp:Transcript_90607/g.251962  ORF Transcript_90607/g.251962 Transcript_90607/m.251962 type:complete len:308 (-) Transcript_90607:154-1077(-)|eukprot:CAMPEP_0179120116 /NCGR_PEP_ID=MMETSP0796-20121207/56579_1 /TAXON_ID=73915 /ORGANISM="Pyrodinium bahamense, Strain pbaha01" /LENGTH=307 /DNA_ID=CAMNT_0020818647 /DNA_START=52 /DNA_END=975 /DNA_ORIENTATION=+
MLPLIVAALAAAGVAYLWTRPSIEPKTCHGPRHEPGQAPTEEEKQLILEEAKVKAEKEAQTRMEQEAEEAQQQRDEEAVLRLEEWERKKQEMINEAAERALLEEEERRRREREEYPMPRFLSEAGGTTDPNWAVVGDSGQGKSSLVNMIMGQKVAEVGTIETTLEPQRYTVDGYSLHFWDLPGAGSAKFPKDTYIRTMGLRYFDLVFVVSCGRWKEHDLQIIQELEKHGVPSFVVRTKVDQDVANELDDNDVEPSVTLQRLRKECKAQGLTNAYLITTKRRELSQNPNWYDNDRLFKHIVHAASHVR